MVGTRADLARVSDTWPTGGREVPEGIANMLRVSRELFVHSYFVYEFSVVAVTWSLIAIEAALRDCLGAAADRAGLTGLVGKAQGRGWLTVNEAERLRAGAQLRNRLAHADGQVNFTVGMAAPMLEAAHSAVRELYLRSSPNSRSAHSGQ